jgi:hypothetical protein
MCKRGLYAQNNKQKMMNIKHFACLSCPLIKTQRGFKKLDNQSSNDKNFILNLISNFGK